MINWPPEHAEMGKIEAALIRAAQAARDLARMHGEPIVVWRDGKVVLELVDDVQTAKEAD
jgi:argonaute-like protein implicated in RNA metabolism and viral defense